jgi:hypothetical protein
MEMESQFTVVPLPTSLSSTIIAKYRAVRLLALKISPQFWSSYETEEQLTEDQWREKLGRNNVKVLICIRSSSVSTDAEPGAGVEVKEEAKEGKEEGTSFSPSDRGRSKHHDEDASLNRSDPIPAAQENVSLLLEQHEFVGTISIQGPMPSAQYDLLMVRSDDFAMKRDEAPAALETKWQLGSLFTDPAHRENGIAVLLGMAAYGFARDETLKMLSAINNDQVGIVGGGHGDGFEDLRMPATTSEALGSGDLESSTRLRKGAGTGRRGGEPKRHAIVAIRAMVQPGPIAERLVAGYKRASGLREMARKCNLKEVFESAGDGDLVPQGWEKMPKWATSNIIVMEDRMVTEGEAVGGRMKGGGVLGERLRSRL